MKDRFEKAQMDVVEISTIKRADYNPKIDHKPGDPEFEDLKNSIREFGQVIPMVINRKTGTLVSGHQTMTVLQHLGWKFANVVYVDEDDDRERALNAAINKIKGRYDEKKLVAMFLQLPEALRPLTGWKLKEIKAMELKLPGMEPHEDLFDPDAAAEEIQEPITKRGDIIILGDHRLMCGDSTDREDVSKLMSNEIARMIFTDPPYNVNYGRVKNPKYGSSTRRIFQAKHSNGPLKDTIANDNQSAPDWLEFNKRLFEIFKEFCDGDLYMWGASGPDGMTARQLLVDVGCHWSATIIWAKDSLVISPANYHRKYEPCFYGWFGRSSFNNAMGSGNDRSGLTDVWEIPRPKASDLHPTMKPVLLCAKAIQNSSDPGQVVLDLFGGSGSTLIAAEQTGRRCFMMELEPLYCDVIVQRWEEQTGGKAVRP